MGLIKCGSGRSSVSQTSNKIPRNSESLRVSVKCKALNKTQLTSLVVSHGLTSEGYPNKITIVKSELWRWSWCLRDMFWTQWKSAPVIWARLIDPRPRSFCLLRIEALGDTLRAIEQDIEDAEKKIQTVRRDFQQCERDIEDANSHLTETQNKVARIRKRIFDEVFTLPDFSMV